MSRENVVGKKFGEWLVLADAPDRVLKSGSRNRVVLCRCSCGVERELQLGNLKSGGTKMCIQCVGKRLTKDELGNRYGSVVVISRIERRMGTSVMWRVRCDCGVEYEVAGATLRKGKSKQCRKCADKAMGERNRKYHTEKEIKLERLLHSMKGRCYQKKSRAYHRYGGRGIFICDEWMSDTFSFINWAIENGYEFGLQIDRIDNNKGYSPDNCRFVTSHINCCNRSMRKNKNSGYTGVYYSKGSEYYNSGYQSSIYVNRKYIYLGQSEKPEDACKLRNDYIIENGLTEYKIQKLYGSTWKEDIVNYLNDEKIDLGRWIKDDSIVIEDEYNFELF